MLFHSIDGYLRMPFAFASTPLHAFKPGLVVLLFGSVLLVFRTGHHAQIGNAVVESVVVDVVNIALWKFSVRVKPCQPVGEVVPFVHTDNSIAFFVEFSGNASDADSSAAADAPCKSPRCAVVTQQFF